LKNDHKNESKIEFHEIKTTGCSENCDGFFKRAKRR
jgi:hypothetical protein